jgi:hypothetical protein
VQEPQRYWPSQPGRGDRNFRVQRRKSKVGLIDRRCHQRTKKQNDTGETARRNGLFRLGLEIWGLAGLGHVVKLTFSKGASLKDPSGLFNSSLEGNARRAIDFHEGDEIDEDAFKTLIRAAAALNRSSAR